MRRTTAAGLTAMLLLAGAGCGALGGGSDTPSAEPPASLAPSASQQSAPGTPSSGAQTSAGTVSPGATGVPAVTPSPVPADPSATAGGDQLGEVVATRTSSKSGQPVTMTLYPVLRDGATAHVNLALSSPVDDDDRVQIASMLSDGDSDSSDRSVWAADGLQLVDGVNSKVHLVASTGQGECLCSRELQGVFLAVDAPVLFSATFAAPPPDVTSVDVRVPGFGTVPRVALR